MSTGMQEAIQAYRAKREAERQRNWELLQHRLWLWNLNRQQGETEGEKS